MKKLLLTLCIMLSAVATTTAVQAQNSEAVQFARGAREKTVSVTLGGGASKVYSIQARGGQAILVTPKGANSSQVYLEAADTANVENIELIEKSLHILTQNSGQFLIRVKNTSSARKTFAINFFVDSSKFF
jgi:DNA mismatch repair protein MutH